MKQQVPEQLWRFIYVDTSRTLGIKCDCQLSHFVTFVKKKKLLIILCAAQELFCIFPGSKHPCHIMQLPTTIRFPLFSIYVISPKIVKVFLSH